MLGSALGFLSDRVRALDLDIDLTGVGPMDFVNRVRLGVNLHQCCESIGQRVVVALVLYFANDLIDIGKSRVADAIFEARHDALAVLSVKALVNFTSKIVSQD